MVGLSWHWLWRGLTASCLLCGCLTVAAAPAGEPPAPKPAALPVQAPPDPNVNIFLNAPADLDALWKAMARPDFVILRGEEYNRLRKAVQEGAGRPGPSAAVVESVSVQGTVRDDQASLTIEFRIALDVDGPTWAPLRLDGLTLAGAREGGHDLPVRTADGSGRQVQLAGRGKHTVQVETLVPVLLTAEGKRLELAIPVAATTRFAIDVPRRVAAAHAGLADPVSRTSVRESGLTRLAADLPPRPKLSVVWRVEEEAGTPLPPLLAAQGEIAVDIEPGSLRTRSTWVIRSVRGTARNLQFRLDPTDELLELELDGQPPPAGMDRVDGATRLTIPLTDPLGPGKERKLVMSTRRPMPVGGTARMVLTGFPLTSARDQAGAIGVTQSGGSWISGTAARGVRQIDPRTELPAELRARPSTVLAYQFSAQPFELDLRLEPSPPQVRTESRTTVVLDPGIARVDTWIDYQTARGRLYELMLAVPPGLSIESVGPEEVADSWQTGGLAPGTTPLLDVTAARLLTVRLSPKVQDGGRFGLHVVGRQGVDASRGAKVGLLRPAGPVSGGGRIAVLTDPSLTAELNEAGETVPSESTFRPATQAPPVDWPWPSGRAPASGPMLWLKHLQNPSELPLRITAHSRSVTQSTSLQARVDRREVDVQQETECAIRFGAIDHLDVAIPSALAGHWDLESSGVASRADLGPTARGEPSFRLNLAGEATRSARLRFHYRLPVGSAPGAGRPFEVSVPWIRLLGPERATTPIRATVSAEPGLAVTVSGEKWKPVADLSAAADDVEGTTERLVRSAPEADVSDLPLQVTARPLATLPRVVAPRLSLRTIQSPEGDLRTTACFSVETQEVSLSFSLPQGAELQRVRVGGETLEQIEQLAQGGGFRVALPVRLKDDVSPVPVELDYVVPAASARGAWVPISLLGGGLVQQTLWEIRLPWSRALVGVPGGWSDENDWYFDGYLWKRRPWRPRKDLITWALGVSARPGESEPDDARSDYHGYQFGRPGQPVNLPVTVVSRAWLVGLGSGSVLLVGGFLIVVWRPTVRVVWGVALVFGVLLAAWWHPSVTLLVMQSSLVGVLLTALLGLIQSMVERRRRAAGVFGDTASVTPPITPGSTFNRTLGVGSDDSTAIRVRVPPASTRPYTPVPATTPPATTPPTTAPAPAEPDQPAGLVVRASWSDRVDEEGAAP